jgi:hypothetical protein
MNMPESKSQFHTTITVLFALFAMPLAAQDVDQLNWTETKEKWGQVIFCQRIYKMPEVQSRLYSFDIEQCDSAGQLMLNVVTRYSQSQQTQLKNQAEQHAVALSHNTREPYHSVAACRDYCRKLAEIQDKDNDQ